VEEPERMPFGKSVIPTVIVPENKLSRTAFTAVKPTWVRLRSWESHSKPKIKHYLSSEQARNSQLPCQSSACATGCEISREKQIHFTEIRISAHTG
tara:strand:- start:1702 stop:1989 length:288 start_codon:yes stop_codon:yes gene_type:complete